MIEYRKANISDIQYLVQYRKQQLIDEGEVFDNEIDNELFDYFTSSISDNSLISWLAVDGEKIIATSGICFYQLPPTSRNPSGKNAYITNMYTLPEYRKQGIGTQLLQLVIDEAKAQNYKVIRLHASADGKSIYSKAGFCDTDGFMALRF
ncbi:MAG: GNAT family N-acetyltransferase [Oscillospiraceae bacterium]|jgi:ribosomal protein S18 acetylase RimI-like enzyme|nr:GNAT family N-acetyltransferase [Oscillospiraceae bacterium]